jgi:hypothetical protein
MELMLPQRHNEENNKIVSFSNNGGKSVHQSIPVSERHPSSSKIISIDPPSHIKKVIAKKAKVKRVITSNIKKWTFSQDELSPESQNELIKIMNREMISNNETVKKNTDNINFVHQQMKQKIYGYRTQDIKNNILNPSIFVELEDIIEKCFKCNLACFYCNEPVMILYEHVRDPKQWTVERIDNNYGHNHNNFEIACLSCNIRRRTIHFERYILTKQLKHIKKVET